MERLEGGGMTPGVQTNGARGMFLARVARNESICHEHWRLTLVLEDFPEAAPGQFVQVLCAEPKELGWTQGAFIRRPFSIGGLRREGRQCEIDILHRAIGTGTRWLARLQPGESVSILGPLGRGFQVPPDRSPDLLVGGGIGLPPLIWLAAELHRMGRRAVAFCGARSADLLPLTRVPGMEPSSDEGSLAFEEFASVGVPVVVGTDDGSLGTAARVPDLLAAWLQRHPDQAGTANIYTCGPEAMLRAVARIGMDRGIPTQAAMERVMACGMGTCQSCVVPMRDASAVDGWRYRLCCTDGPVFDVREVIWG